jgi:hypothetical protein
MVDSHPKLEFAILRVEESYRIRLTQPLLRRVAWITGGEPVSGWLLVGSPGRCRLLSASEVGSDPHLQSLKMRITAEANTRSASPLDFHDEVSVALAARLLEVQITPPEPGWRLTIPRPIAAIMQIRPKESEVAGVFVQEHIELWTIETLRSSVARALTEIL